MDESTNNPYAAPLSRSVPVDPLDGQGPKPRPVTWTVLYVTNLIVPGLLGFQAVEGPLGTIGMVAAVIFFYGVTVACGERWKSLYLPGCIGAGFVAFSQFYPMLQLYAGMGGLLVSEFVFGVGAQGGLSFAPAALTTVVTGLLLLTVAMIIGVVGAVIVRTVSPRAERP